MPYYRVLKYEVHSQPFLVLAESEDDALCRLTASPSKKLEPLGDLEFSHNLEIEFWDVAECDAEGSPV